MFYLEDSLPVVACRQLEPGSTTSSRLVYATYTQSLNKFYPLIPLVQTSQILHTARLDFI